jgi:hypothetical protein
LRDVTDNYQLFKVVHKTDFFWLVEWLVTLTPQFHRIKVMQNLEKYYCFVATLLSIALPNHNLLNM